MLILSGITNRFGIPASFQSGKVNWRGRRERLPNDKVDRRANRDIRRDHEENLRGVSAA
jgi:hypothetical protein